MAHNESPTLLLLWNKEKTGRKVAAKAVEAPTASTNEPLQNSNGASNPLGFRKPHSMAVRNQLILRGQPTDIYGFRNQIFF
jgi:hypothetical protein